MEGQIIEVLLLIVCTCNSCSSLDLRMAVDVMMPPVTAMVSHATTADR